MLTQGRLHSLFNYDMAAGELVWRFRPRTDFTADRSFNTFNTLRVGKVAGNIDCLDGYRKIGIDGRLYKAHRLVWVYVHGEWPVGEVDHINHDKADNRIANLRVVTRRDNERNKPRRKDNTSGHPGVGRHGKSWRVFIGSDRIGTFPTKEAAIAARSAAEIERGYHSNHGAG